jgi:F-type H+-transporting ATPase subunit b
MAEIVPESAHHAASSGGLPQFNAEWFPSQLFWLAVTFAVLFWYFSRIALPRIAATIQARQNTVAGDITMAEGLTKKAADLRAEYERNIARARDKASDAIRAIDARIKEKTADGLYAYRTKVTMEIARAEDDIAHERARLVDDMNRLAADITTKMAEKILDTSVDTAQVTRVVEQLNPVRQAA